MNISFYLFCYYYKNKLPLLLHFRLSFQWYSHARQGNYYNFVATHFKKSCTNTHKDFIGRFSAFFAYVLNGFAG